MSIELMVLAGGFGTRLREAVPDLPKPMAPINGVPLLKLQLDHWIKQGQRSFIFLLYYEAQSIIKLLLEQSERYGNSVKIRWVIEEEPLGTGGSVANAVTTLNLKGAVLIANADTWLDDGLLAIRKKIEPTIAVIKVKNTSRYGSIECRSDGLVRSFVEKRMDDSKEIPGIINAGLYKLSSDLFSHKTKQNFSIETEILPRLVKTNSLRASILEGNFFDIGVPADYYKFCTWQKTQEGRRG
ncbi:sugar phosphate nucleotidyltransferase [Planktomarina temperata]|nr:sugar phosphate nucleotidyltransferase [Planktomarina temperata]